MSLLKIFSIKRLSLSVFALLFVGALVFAYQFRLFERVWFNFQAWKHADQWREKSLWLPDYKVTIEGKPIEGIHKNISALTWNKDTHTLFSVINQPTQVVELSTEGEILRRVDLIGVSDPEAIEYIGNNRFIIADERRQRLVMVTINKDDHSIDASNAQQITLGIGLNGNKGLEGLAWDSRTQRIYAAKERNPIHIFEVTGFPQAPNTTMSIEIKANSKRDDRLFIRDLSSLDFDEHYGHLLVLSDESKLILEIDTKGHPISSLSLLAGMHGLSQSVPQAEGMALDDQDNLYLVSEPNLFYVFKKAK